MKKTRKALLSMILSAAMVIAMLPGMSMVAKADDTYTITVSNGTADKTLAAEGETVTITANDNIEFLGWGAMTQEDVNLLADSHVKTTTFTMPARDIFFVAMTPSGGSGSGGGSGSEEGSGSTPQQYTISKAAGCTVTANSESVTSAAAGTQITITAEDRTSFNFQFDHWEITENNATSTDITSTILLGNAAKDSSTTFSMPAKNICVMPVFAPVSGSGSGSGSGNEGGETTSGEQTTAQQEGSNNKILFRKSYEGFDVQGKDGDNTIQTTCGNSGYTTEMKVGESTTSFTGFEFGKKYTCDGVDGAITAQLSGNSVDLTYTLTNTTTGTKTVNIGSHADTQIGTDDDAPVSFTDKGIKMISKDGKYAFVVNPASGDFTTRWYGYYGDAGENVFNNRTDSNTYTSDSGVAWSWTVEIPANSTVTRTARLAAGDAASIIEPQSDTNSSTATIAVSGETAVKGENPIVPNLNSEAASQGDDVTLDMQITADAETTFAANPTLNSEPEVKEEVKGQFKDESAIKVDVLHINVRKLVAGVFAATLTNTNSVLEIAVGYNFTGKYDPSLVSKHGDEVRTFATLTARPTAGNYINSSFFADTENDKFFIYSKDYSDFVISYSTVEGNAQNRTVINPNAGGSSGTSSSPKTIPVYRLFNKVNGNHLFTTNAEEKDILVAYGWADEGIAWQVVANTATPVYRLFDAAGSGEHYYTANEALKAELIAKGCVDEGVAWYGQAATGRTVYKVTNTKYGKSVLTTSVEEKDALVAAGFTVEEADFKVN